MNESSKINETPEALIKSSRENGASGVQREHFTPLSDYGYGGRDASEGIPLRNYWRSIRKHKWLVILITVIITTLVLLYVAASTAWRSTLKPTSCRLLVATVGKTT